MTPRRLTLAAVSLIALTAAAQPPRPATYASVSYSRWKPGKQEEGRRFMDEAARKMAAVNVADLTGRAVLDRVFPGGQEAGHDRVTILFRNRPPQLGSPMPQALQQALGMTAAEYNARLESLRDPVKQEIWTDVYRHGSFNAGDFVVFRYLDPTIGKAAEYLNHERDIENPMREELVKRGTRKSQQLWQLRLTPEQAPYNIVNVSASPNSETLFEPMWNRLELFQKVHPKGEYYRYRQESASLSTLVKMVVYRVVSADWR
jgi:hypothetical protein